MDKNNSESNHATGTHMSESLGWFLLGTIMLMTLLSNFAPIFGVPWWVFMVSLFGLAMVLAVQSSPQMPLFRMTGERQWHPLRRIIVSVTAILVLIEAVWLGFYIQNWPLFAVWLPATLLIGVILYLVIAVVVENTAPSLYLIVPVTAFLAGGLLWLVWSSFGYLNLFLLCFALLSFGASVWSRFRLESR